MAWGANLFMIILNIWLPLHMWLNGTLSQTAGGFVLLLLPVIFVLLLCLAIFPDDPRQESKDLLAWYFERNNYLFALFPLNWISFGVIRSFRQFDDTGSLLPLPFELLFPAALYLLLIATRNIWVHSMVTALYFLVFVTTIVGTPMTLQ